MGVETSGLILDLLAGVSRFGVSPSFAERVLSAVPVEAVLELIESLLGDGAAVARLGQDAYRHPNGFVKLPVRREAFGLCVRLHYWPAEVQAEENVHNHRWELASRVVFGALDSEQYELAPGEALRQFAYGRRGREAWQEERGRASVRRTVTQCHHAGAAYHLAPERLHRIQMRAGVPTLTLMVQSAPVAAENLMLCRDLQPELAPPPLGEAGVIQALGAIREHLREAA